MPRPAGRPKKEGKVAAVKNPRGAPKKVKPKEPLGELNLNLVTELYNDAQRRKGGEMQNHAKFGMEEPCRVIVSFVDGLQDEVVCKSYSYCHGVLYLTTKTGEQVVPPGFRKFEAVRL